MDAPSVSSSSKCSSSDFSIKRILSESRSRPDAAEVPSWLCCTRYQPPRLPRTSANISGNRPRRSGRHARVPFTGAQSAALEAAYARAPYLAPPALRALAAALQLRDDRIKIWFQNRRARERREKNGNITPPRAITLQPTAFPRISAPEDLAAWNRLQSHTRTNSTLSPIDYRQTNMDTKYTVSNTINSVASVFNNVRQPISNVFELSGNGSASENDRCESPLDIETVDT